MINNKKWYSIIIAILVIGFLFTLTWAVYKLVLVELNDNRWRYNYLKSYYWSKWAWELVLLTLKEKWYGYDENIEFDKNDYISNILNFSWWNSNPLISYSVNSKVSSYTGEIDSLWYDIIPLFYMDRNSSGQTLNLSLTVNSWSANELAWNILSSDSWLSWTWEFDSQTQWFIKQLDYSQAGYDFLIDEKAIQTFLSENSDKYNYLILFNWDSQNQISYHIDSQNEFFTKPRTDIFVSWKMWWYKQNFSINYDNTQYLGLLKYSIFNN